MTCNPLVLRSALGGAFCVFLASIAVSAEPGSSWPQFRGPNGNGIVTESHPIQWDASTNLAWSTEIPGGGWSSPVVAGAQVYVTSAVSPDDSRPKGWGEGVQSMGSFYRSKPPSKPLSFQMHCLNLETGALLWSKEITSRKPAHKIHPSNSYATESPITDGENVYAYFAAIGAVACLDKEGSILWQKEVGEFPTANDFGTGSSLAMHEGRLFIQSDNEKESFVCALSAEKGEELWRVERKSRTSWSSPLVWKNSQRVELVVCGSGYVTSYDPETGNVLWNLTGMGSAFSASPTADADRLYLGNSARTTRGPLVAVNAGAKGELDLESIGDTGVAWVQDSAGPGMSSPVAVDGRVYVLSRGILNCHSAETGERIYRERLPKASSVTASLWAMGDKVFALNESGETAVIKVGDDFELVTSNQIDGLYWSTPSAANDSLLMRDAANLHCIRK